MHWAPPWKCAISARHGSTKRSPGSRPSKTRLLLHKTIPRTRQKNLVRHGTLYASNSWRLPAHTQVCLGFKLLCMARTARDNVRPGFTVNWGSPADKNTGLWLANAD